MIPVKEQPEPGSFDKRVRKPGREFLKKIPKPKSLYPSLAYEWSNYRFVALRYNNSKGTKKILDPFTLKPDWFVLDFKDEILNVKPNAALIPEEKNAVNKTIETLRLNTDPMCKKARVYWLTAYCRKKITFEHLNDMAPFIAYELERQGLQEEIFHMFSGPGLNNPVS